jgi:hypothetical protein
MTAPTYKSHPLANRFPPMTYTQRGELVDDIRSRGLLEPITLYEGMILDGRNRYRACLEAEVTPRFVQYTGGNPIAFVWSKNGARRHLSEAKRLELAKTFARLLLIDDPGQSDRQVAEVVGISHPTVAKLREEGERTGDVERVSTRRDSAGRKQPAHQPPHPRPQQSLIEAVTDLIDRIVSGFDSVHSALRDLSEAQHRDLWEGVRRAQARLAAIASLITSRDSVGPNVPTESGSEFSEPEKRAGRNGQLSGRPPDRLPNRSLPNQTGERCATCGAAGVELFGYRIKGELQWFCAEHRKARHYADAHRSAEGKP